MYQILSSVTRVQIQNDFTVLPRQWSGFTFLALGMIASESLIQLPKLMLMWGWKRMCRVGAAWHEVVGVPGLLHCPMERRNKDGTLETSKGFFAKNSFTSVWYGFDVSQGKGGGRTRREIIEHMDGQRGDKEKILFLSVLPLHSYSSVHNFFPRICFPSIFR